MALVKKSWYHTFCPLYYKVEDRTGSIDTNRRRQARKARHQFVEAHIAGMVVEHIIERREPLGVKPRSDENIRTFRKCRRTVVLNGAFVNGSKRPGKDVLAGCSLCEIGTTIVHGSSKSQHNHKAVREEESADKGRQ